MANAADELVRLAGVVNAQLMAADCVAQSLKELLGVPMNVDKETIPNAGIESCPKQVVYEASISLVRVRAARKALELFTTLRAGGGMADAQR